MNGEYLSCRCDSCGGDYIVFPEDMNRLGKNIKHVSCPYCKEVNKRLTKEYDDWQECMKNKRGK
jgi:NAD-dependent SIR2 family protein deacetylase